MLPARKSVAIRITHRRWSGGTAILSQRRGLLNEAEEVFDTFGSSASLPPSERRYPDAFCGFTRADQSFIQIQRHQQEVNPHDDLVSQAVEAYYELTDQER